MGKTMNKQRTRNILLILLAIILISSPIVLIHTHHTTSTQNTTVTETLYDPYGRWTATDMVSQWATTHPQQLNGVKTIVWESAHSTNNDSNLIEHEFTINYQNGSHRHLKQTVRVHDSNATSVGVPAIVEES